MNYARLSYLEARKVYNCQASIYGESLGKLSQSYIVSDILVLLKIQTFNAFIVSKLLSKVNETKV